MLGSAFEADPLVYPFAQRGIKPMRLHQVRKSSATGEPYKILIVDTYPWDSLEICKRVQTLCGINAQVVGAVTFLRREDQEWDLDGCPFVSAFTHRSLIELCLKHDLTPPFYRAALNRHLEQAA
jgi:hypothetical protein